MTRVLSTISKIKSMLRLPVAIPTALAIQFTYEAIPTLLFVWHLSGDIENVAIVENISTFLGVRNRPKVWVPFIYLFFYNKRRFLTNPWSSIKDGLSFRLICLLKSKKQLTAR